MSVNASVINNGIIIAFYQSQEQNAYSVPNSLEIKRSLIAEYDSALT